jgi:hypothetical protein
MNIARLLSNAGLFVIEDSQAKHRKFDKPESLPLSYIDSLDTLETVGQVASTYPTPLVLVLQSGQAIVLTESGKGGIAVQGLEEQMTEAQLESLAVVTQVLNDLFDLAVKPTTKKRSTRKSPEPVEGDLSGSEAMEALSDPDAPEKPLEGDLEANEGI